MSTTTDANKAVVQRFFDAFNAHDLSLLEGCVSKDLVLHAPGLPPTFDGLLALGSVLLAAFPDQHSTIELTVAEGDSVVALHTHNGTHTGEFMGIPPTGRPFSIRGIELFRIRDGKIVEFYANDDLLGLLQQLGVA